MVDERVGLCGACESACESEPSKRFRVLRHHPARMSWHWALCKLILHLPLLNNPNYTALPRSAAAIEHYCWPVFESIEICILIRLS